jgi:O-antigen ligase
MKRFFNKKNVFVFAVILLFSVCAIFLLRESVERVLFLSLTFFLWLSIFLYTKDLVFSSILYILIVLPFNVTLQLPSVVEIFNTSFTFPSPFVNGISVNYLIPTVSIVDLAVVLFLVSALVQKGFSFYWDLLKSLKNGVVVFFYFLIIQNVFLRNSLVVFNSLRFFLYILAIVVIVAYYKEESVKKLFLPASFVFLLNVLIQGGIGVLQVLRGTSLGLSFLGESQVVAGMRGSSFVDLGGRTFLRAYGTFPHPNVLAGFLILGMLIGVLCSKRSAGLGVSLVIVSLGILILTFSRVVFLVAVIILFLLFLRSISRAKVKEFSVSPLLFLERFTNLLGGGDRSWSERVDLLKASIEVIKENFFLGTGLGNFVRAMEDYVPRSSEGLLILQPVHNVFLLLFSELGVFGFFSFFYILVRLFLENFKRFTYFKVAVLLAIVIIGFWDHYLFSLPQGLGIFLFLYVLLVLDLKTLDYYEGDVSED